MICNVCREVPAEVFNTTDKASMCRECDGRLQPSARAAKTSVPLTGVAAMPPCDVCQEECSTFFCKECRALLCPSCDGAMHKTAIACAHHRFVISSTRVDPGGTSSGASRDRSMNGMKNSTMASVGGDGRSPGRYSDASKPGSGVGGIAEVPVASGRGVSDSYNAGTSGMFDRGTQGSMPTMSFVDGNPVAELLHIPSLGDDYGIKDVDVDDFYGISNAEWEGLQNALFEAPQSVPGSGEGNDFGFGTSGAVGYDDDSAVPDFGAPSNAVGGQQQQQQAGASKRQRMMY